MATAAIDCLATVPFTDCRIIAKKSHFLAQRHGEPSPKQLIGDALRRRVENINHEFCAPGDEDTFFVADLGEVYRQHVRWQLNLPRVVPFYAVKCNPDPMVLRLLSELGTGFDCASKAEIEQVLDMGVDPSRIVYAQPCKTNSYVRYVSTRGVRQMTFDNADELRKIAKLFPDAELLLRILTDDSLVAVPSEPQIRRLPRHHRWSLDTNRWPPGLRPPAGPERRRRVLPRGVGSVGPFAFLKAVRDAHVVFQQAASYGFDLKTLDVGGGFCSDASFEDMAGVLRSALDEYFPAHSGVSLIAEPGRYFVSSAFTIACNVIARPHHRGPRCRRRPEAELHALCQRRAVRQLQQHHV